MEKLLAWVILGLLIVIVLGGVLGHPVSKMFGAKDRSWNDPWPLWKKILWGIPLFGVGILILFLSVKK